MLDATTPDANNQDESAYLLQANANQHEITTDQINLFANLVTEEQSFYKDIGLRHLVEILE